MSVVAPAAFGNSWRVEQKERAGMRTRKEIEKEAVDCTEHKTFDLILEVLLDIREQQTPPAKRPR